MKKNKKKDINENIKIIKSITIISITLILLLICYLLLNRQTPHAVKLEITCNNKKTTGIYNKGDKFKCNLGKDEYTFTIKSIQDYKIIFVASDYGLCQATEDGAISLTGKYNTFKIYKEEPAKIYLQATDGAPSMKVRWINKDYIK